MRIRDLTWIWVATVLVGCESSGGTPAGPSGKSDALAKTDASDTAGADGGTIGGGQDAGGSDGGACLPVVITVKTPADEDPSCKLTTDLVGLTAVVDKLVVTEPDNETVTVVLNDLWKKDIADDKLIILFHIVAHDPATGIGEAEVGSGKLEGGVYGWYDKPTVVALKTAGCHFESSSSTQFSLNAPTITKPVVITNFAIAGQLLGDGGGVKTAAMRGTIRKADAEGLDIDLGGGVKLGLVTTFESAGIALDADTDGDCAMDAWILAGDLTAKAATNVDLK